MANEGGWLYALWEVCFREAHLILKDSVLSSGTHTMKHFRTMMMRMLSLYWGEASMGRSFSLERCEDMPRTQRIHYCVAVHSIQLYNRSALCAQVIIFLRSLFSIHCHRR